MVTDYLINGPVKQDIISMYLGNASEMADSGAHSIFLGQVRSDEVDGRKVVSIDYSAYGSMVKAEADNIKALIFSEFSEVKEVYIVHSLGIVKAGELSLFVMISASHRYQATTACSRVVELIKERLPVWKKEIFDDESHQWKKPT